ncbi:MAG: hypothetical protein JSW03_09150 [Candidatus Eiseniibacteriota bacterium]|nr:MAG: hypothetical protein JSW03_09150 [Candidatus Eisenbacteria bacterium]
MRVERVRSGEFWLSVRLAISALGSRRLLAPFFIYGAVQLGMLVWLCSFHVRELSPAAEPFVRLLGSEAATHYPHFYAALPAVLERAFLMLHVLVGTALMGAATAMFWRNFGHGSCSLVEAISVAGRRYLPLVGVALVIDLVAVTLSTFAYRLTSGEGGGLLAAPFVGRGLALFSALVVQTLGAYGVASVIISDTGFLGAIRRTLKVAGRNFAVTFVVIAIAFLPHVPLRYLASKSLVIVENLKPELVAWLMGLDVFIAVVTGFFVVATVTRLYLFAVGEE